MTTSGLFYRQKPTSGQANCLRFFFSMQPDTYNACFKTTTLNQSAAMTNLKAN